MKHLLNKGKFLSQKCALVLGAFFLLSLISCTAEIKVISPSNSLDESISGEYSGTLGPALEKLVATVSADSDFDFHSWMKGRITFKKNPLDKMELSPENLLKLYEYTDQDTRDLLDLFLSPVFSGETMTEEEYLETVASIYGKDVAKELENSTIQIEVKGKITSISLPKLLTLDEKITLF